MFQETLNAVILWGILGELEARLGVGELGCVTRTVKGIFLTHDDDHNVGTDPAGKRTQGPRFPLKGHRMEDWQKGANMKLKLMHKMFKRTKLKFNNWIPKLLGVGAITIYPWVFIAGKKEKTETPLIKHEMIHIWQVRQHGWWSFYVSYLLYWLAGIVRWKVHAVAYLQIPYEAEAYGNQKELLDDWMEYELKGQWSTNNQSEGKK